VTHIANTNDFLQKYFPDTEEWIKLFKNFHEKSTPQNWLNIQNEITDLIRKNGGKTAV
jgi:hypothetical protein